MKATVEEQINKNFNTIDVLRYKQQLIAQVKRQYRESLMNRGYDLRGKGEFLVEKFLKERVEIKVKATLKTSKKELEEIVKGGRTE